MSFLRPTLTELKTRILADYKSRITGSKNFLRRSFIKIIATVQAGAVHLVFGNIKYQSNQLFSLLADNEYLDLHASEVGKIRKSPVSATGEITITGTSGIAIPEDTELVSDNDVVYLTDEEVVITGGTINVEITAKAEGADGNDEGGIELTFVSPITGVDSTATVTAFGIISGLDEEDDDDLRERILERKRQAPYGGANHDYKAWTLEISGITRAWVFDLWQGAGTVGIAFVRDNDANTIIPNTEQREEVSTYIEYHVDPVTGEDVGAPVPASVYIIDVSLQSYDFSISLYPNTSTVKNAIIEKLNDLFLSVGGPGQTVALSVIDAAISAAVGEEKHKITYPASDISTATNKIPVLGTITWSDYQ